MTTCVSCNEDKLIAARGLCRTCYSRWQRTGQLERKNLVRAACSVEGCENRAHGQGLCSKHFQRMRKRGTLEAGRTYPQKSGLPSQHDLYVQWTEFRRVKNTRPVVQVWVEDFDVFVAGVGGERPSRRHRLYPIDRSQPMGPGNYEWREALIEKLPGESKAAYDKRHSKAHRAMYPGSYKHHNLTRHFGPDFGFAEYEAMYQSQGGVCAICSQPETVVDNHGNLKLLAVDHDHATGTIRQLLCQACNQGLGNFRDNPKTMLKAIAYLAKHGIT